MHPTTTLSLEYTEQNRVTKVPSRCVTHSQFVKQQKLSSSSRLDPRSLLGMQFGSKL